MVFLGLDASSNVTGWSVIESHGKHDNTLLALGEIHLAKFKRKAFPLEYIQVLYQQLTAIIVVFKPEKCIIEDIYALNKLTYKSLSRIRGVCEIACLNNNIRDVQAISSSSARKAVFGNGGLNSAMICIILEKRFEKPLATSGFDQSDALVIALSGAISLCHRDHE